MAKTGPKGPSRYKEEYVNLLAEQLIEYAGSQTLPFLNKFALDRRIPPQALTDNKAFSENEEFTEAMAIAKGWIEYRLSSLALEKKIDTTMAIFCLKQRHIAGWTDKLPEEKDVDDILINQEITIINEAPQEKEVERFKQYFN